MATKTTVVKSGGSFGGLLMILFIALKLTGVIAWTWYWVLFPITLPLTIFIIGGAIFGIGYLIYQKWIK